MPAKLKDGVFDAKESILEDLTVVHRDSLFVDITLTMSDNVRLDTNKFMLACRSPFFATMLFGGHKNKIGDNVAVDCCDSTIMKKVLDFIWNGTVHLADMDVQSLLDLLETSRMMCLDSLNKGVEEYLEILVAEKKIDFDDCLVAFDFVISHRFEALAECFLNFIDENLQNMIHLPRFAKLGNDSVLDILKNGNSMSKKIDLFQAFTAWIKDKDDLPENVKSEMIGCFDLKSFTRSEIQNEVRKTDFYTDKDIFDTLQEKYDELEETLTAQRSELETQKQQIKTLKHQIFSKTNKLDDEVSLTAKLRRKLEDDPNMCLALNGGKIHYSSASSYTSDKKVVYEFKDSELINKVEFNLYVTCAYGYTIESSTDNSNWTLIAEYSDMVCRGRQTVYFKKMKMKYLRIKLKVSDRGMRFHINDGDVVAVLDTTTGVRNNQGQDGYNYRGF